MDGKQPGREPGKRSRKKKRNRRYIFFRKKNREVKEILKANT